MTVRTLPLRFNLQQTPTVAELLQATAEQTRMTRRYDMYSFVDMSNDLGLNADVSFVYHGSIRGNDLHLNGSTQKVTEILTNTPGFKFVGMLVYKDDVPYFEVEYLSNRYSREFVDSFKRTFETVVNEMCVKESVADIECCDEEGIAQLDRFNTLNKVPQTMPENETIVSLFQRQASLQPDHTAVVFGDKRYTYRELDEQTDRIASLILSTLNSHLGARHFHHHTSQRVDGAGLVGSPQGGLRLPAPRPELSARPSELHGQGCQRRAAHCRRRPSPNRK